MSKIVRKTQRQFGASAGAGPGGIGQFGSFAASSIAYSLDPAVIQGLSNYLGGWSSAVVGNNSPAIEDVNALDYLWSYQLGYVLQEGVPEWDSATPYYKGSLAQSGGLIYAALQDNFTNQALNQQSYWKAMNGPVYDVICGSQPFCTHANIAAAVSDSNMGTNLNVLIASNDSSAPIFNKNGWRMYSLPGVTITGGWGVTSAANIWIVGCRFSGLNPAITFTSAASYGKVLFCNFASCTTDISDSSPAGKMVVAMGNIDE